MATYFGSIAVPTDNGTNATSPVAFANPPIASMAAGDLVVVYAYCRNASATIDVSNTGGQSWTSETTHQGTSATLTARVFWCRFNGTWSAAPSFSFSSTTNTSVVMHVFRPNTSTNSWGLSTASTTNQENTLTSRASATSHGNPADAATFTPTESNTVSLSIVSSQDDNTWGSLTGAGWTQVTSPASQFRNLAGNDTSCAFAYFLQGAAASIPVTGLSQLANGPDAGIGGLYIWYEFTPPSDIPPLGHFFGPVIALTGLILKSCVTFLKSII